MSPSPNRRKSIAVSHQVNKSRPTHKRRPHSITPGDSVLKQLSPVSRARRSIGPRKSILKSRSSLAPEDADDITQTMDFTRDIRASINENATRKSLGRRVSFASHAQVRVFEKDPNRADVSPSAVRSNHSDPPSHSGAPVNDENDYPGMSSLARRRSSLRRSVAFSGNGESSMDMDSELESSPLPDGFLTQGSFLQDEEPSDVSGSWEEEDMDLTTNTVARKSRKSSLGLSSLTPSGQVMDLDDQPASEDMTQDSTGDTSVERAEPTEFTIPLSKSLRKPEPPSAEWLALRAMTHAGADSPFEPPSSMDEDESFTHSRSVGLGEGDMDITEAETRLRRMRESLGLTNAVQEGSFTSSEESSIGGDDYDNQTVNLTSVWRASLGTDSSSVMDLTNNSPTRVFSWDLPNPPNQHNPRAQPLPSGSTPTPSLTTMNGMPSDTTASPAPSVFTKPGPKRGVEGEDSHHLESQGSPVKKQGPQVSPSKAMPITPALVGSISTSAATRRPSAAGLRGYFAQRKSLGPSGVLNAPPSTSATTKVAQARASIADISDLNQDLVFERENAETPLSQHHPHFPLQDVTKATIVTGPDNSPLSSTPVPPFADTCTVTSAGPEAVAPQITITSAEVDATEQWRNNVQVSSFTEGDEGPPISIDQFFNMTGIRFLDELSAPRRSTILPSQLLSSQRPAETTLSDYVVAMIIDAPQLELYSHVAADLQRWIEHSKEIYRQAEEEATKVTPTLFREYSMADEETQAELLQQLKLIKANNHATARSQWYDWRLQWVEQLHDIANQGFAELEQDARTLETIIQQAENLLPSLREEHAQVTKEFEQEQVIVAEIENCDQDYLKELKGTLAEQGVALDEFRAEVAEANAKLERLEEKLRDLEIEESETTASIEASQRTLHIQKNSTQAEAFRLKDELAALEQLHLFHISRVNADVWEFVYASRFHVHIPCVDFKPLKDQIRITKTKEMLLRKISFRVPQQRLASSPLNLGIKQIVRNLGVYWLGCAKLRTQFTFLSIKYPVSLDPYPPRGDDDHHGLQATATVLLPSVKAKLYVSFILDADTFWGWPMTIGNVDCEIKKSYGPDIDIQKIRAAILQRMSRSTPTDNHACFLDACIEATLDYKVVE
ncbi:Spc7 kinetochore protein-domain-containing protein [Lactifluus volemus]|nr:Spc7 kinetochore protein-domain-containing protein [Lactifluus volemus]